MCIKPVPDPKQADKMTIDGETGTMIRRDIPFVINPLDRHALEAAVQIRERHGGRVTAVSMAPGDALPVLKESLARGADRLVLLSDRRFAGGDTLATACVIASAVRHLGAFDLVMCGDETTDSGTFQVSAQIAEFLDVPNIMHVDDCRVSPGDGLRLRSRTEEGAFTAEGQFPMVVAVTVDINEPRYVTLMDVLDSESKEVVVLSADDLPLEEPWIGLEGSPTRVLELFEPERKNRAEMLSGTPAEQAEVLADRLRRMGFRNG